MGSMTLAVAGGVAGAGKGLEEFGAAQGAQLRQEALMRLKQQFETEQQQRGFAEQEKLQGKTQEFEKSQSERGFQVSAAAAGAQREFVSSEDAKKRASAEKIAARHDAARIAARQAGVQPKTPPKRFELGHYTMQGTVDPTTKQLVPGATVPVVKDSQTGNVWVQAGGRWMPYDATKGNQMPDLKGVRNAKTEAVQNLYDHPETYGDFVRAYGYLPGDFFSRQQAGQPPAAGGPLGANAPKGSTYTPNSTFGGNAASGDEQDAEDDAEDYANTGDEGPQASDNAPAK